MNASNWEDSSRLLMHKGCFDEVVNNQNKCDSWFGGAVLPSYSLSGVGCARQTYRPSRPASSSRRALYEESLLQPGYYPASRTNWRCGDPRGNLWIPDGAGERPSERIVEDPIVDQSRSGLSTVRARRSHEREVRSCAKKFRVTDDDLNDNDDDYYSK